MAADLWLGTYTPLQTAPEGPLSIIRKCTAIVCSSMALQDHTICIWLSFMTLCLFKTIWLYEYSSFLPFSMEQKHCLPLNNYRGTSTHLISGVCDAYYEFSGHTTFQIKTSADVPISHHSHHPHHSSQVFWPHRTCWSVTVECSGPVWPTYQGTGTADQADLVNTNTDSWI